MLPRFYISEKSDPINGENKNRRSMMDRVAKFEKVSFEQFLADYRKMDKGNLLPISDYEVRKIWESIKLPERATSGSAGYDFFLPYAMYFYAGSNVFFPTGIRCLIDDGWVLMLYPKSGLGTKYGTRLLNSTGVVDQDYAYSDNEGHIMCGMRTECYMRLEAGDKFIQGIFFPYGVTKNDDASGKRNGGFGSTGK